MKRKVKIGKRIFLLFLILCMLQGAFGTVPVLGGKKREVLLTHDNRRIGISIPDGSYLTDGLKYCVHRKGGSGGWSVMTTILTDRDDLYELEKSKSFVRENTVDLKGKYLIQYRLKGFYYPVTVLCTEKYKKFFENLTEKDFKIGKKEYSFFNAGFSSDEIRARLKLNRTENTEKLKRTKKIVRTLALQKETIKPAELLKRQRAGVVFAEKLLPFEMESAVIREAFLYEAAGYTVAAVEKDETSGYLELKRGKTVRRLLFTEARIGKKKTGAVLVYSVTKKAWK